MVGTGLQQLGVEGNVLGISRLPGVLPREDWLMAQTRQVDYILGRFVPAWLRHASGFEMHNRLA